MNDYIQKISEFCATPLASFLGLVLGVVGVILAVVFYLKSKRFKALKYCVNTTTLINELERKLKGLQVTYNETPQTRVSISRITIWNSGTDPIVLDDLPSKKPLEIVCAPGAEVLDAVVIYSSDSRCCCKIEEFRKADGSTMIPISFEYLDKEDGTVVQVVHNGSDDHPLSFEGKIMGASGPSKVESIIVRRGNWFPGPLKTLANSKTFSWFGVLFYAVAGILLLIASYSKDRKSLAFGGAFCLFSAFIMYVGYARDTVPRKFSGKT